MVKDHSVNETGNLLPLQGLFFLISSKGSFYMHHPTERTAHTTAFVIQVIEQWLEQEIAQWDRSDDPSHHEQTLLPRSYISLSMRNQPDDPSHHEQMLLSQSYISLLS